MTKLEELELLASELNMGNILIKPGDVIMSIEDKGDLETTFPAPSCSKCVEKCCPPRVVISLFDVARFIDNRLDKLISGKFEGFVKLFLTDTGEDVKLYHPHMFPMVSDAKDCVFLDEDRKCSIYEDRPYVCRSYPIAIRIDAEKNKLALWLGGCRNFEIISDNAPFQRLLDSAIQDYNEKLISNALLMNSRNQLRDIGFGKYMEDEWELLKDYNRQNKDMQLQIQDLQKVLERFRAPQDHVVILQRLQNDNDWLKERLVSLEKELTLQSERAHSIISELTTQLSDQRKLLESFRQSEEHNKKSLWRR